MSLRLASALSRRLMRTEGNLAKRITGNANRSNLSNTRRSLSSVATATFTYRLAAAAAPKRVPPRPPNLDRDFWLYSSAHQDAEHPYVCSTKKDAGEDAFFLATVGQSPNKVAFGVADGVGGWQESGIDPSKFSHGICGIMSEAAHKWSGDTHCKPQELLHIGYDAILNNPRILAGGCTASLAVLDGQGKMEAANLGDSGFLIISPGKVVYRSEMQTHAFNTPFQLSKVPAQMRTQEAIFGGSSHFSETPSQANVTSHQLRMGDIVVFATDGVWDNLSAQDTLAIVTRVMEKQGAWFRSHNFSGAETLLNEALFRSMPEKIERDQQDKYIPGLIATAIMREAKVAGLDRRRDGPFAKEVKAHYPLEGWQGGKPDDIAVAVGIAIEHDGSKQTEQRSVKAKL